MALKQPTIKYASASGKPDRRLHVPMQAPGAAETAEKPLAIPLLGRLPVAAQLQVLGSILLGLILLTAAAAFLDNRAAAQNARYVTQSSKLLMLSQRLARDAGQSLSGDPRAFENLARSRESFGSILALLDKGDDNLPATSGAARAALDGLMARSTKLVADARALEASRPAVAGLNRAAAAIRASAPELRELALQLADHAPGPQKERAVRLGLALERIAADAAATVLAGEAAGAKEEQLPPLKQDVLEAEELLKTFSASEPPVARINAAFDGYRAAAASIAADTPALLEARRAGRAILENSDALMSYMQKLVDAYQSAGRVTGMVMIVAGVLVLLMLMLVSKVYLDDSRQRAREAERANRRDQEAILRLMDELGDLAEGNLKVKATVSEDITGAIADSVNYTIEELRKLVIGITAASDQVTGATRAAEEISTGLLAAAQKQSDELKGAGEAVQLMIKSIQEVDGSAAQSAEVARRTLEVTEQGEQAVQNTIAGMDGIRGQIQETSKRIKRLGESSQEIGEIVEMISDITEQTNVLALNAAIQAASAGEAGRGFSVVAEEVQRLAERSAEATRQIGALVRTIQGDTQDAVAAMEQSTQGVVAGTKLSDAAGQSLREIAQVSHELAQLIGSISVSTQVQTDMAQEVEQAMAEIVRINEQTTAGTRLTNSSVAELAGLAAGLKASVSGFKL
ncbi:MAG: type IV pili methyl-accepting chemotaxis transducer N-terminal domain-containing protein [Nitrosomonadales bacterium]|nr:type IV pili methyl-accepting chemotaxis transducer N-terminal domain-containing protein [Nitrosomonadales bacterium]